MERFFHKEWTGLNETLANAVDTTSSSWNEWAGVGQSVQTSFHLQSPSPTVCFRISFDKWILPIFPFRKGQSNEPTFPINVLRSRLTLRVYSSIYTVCLSIPGLNSPGSGVYLSMPQLILASRVDLACDCFDTALLLLVLFVLWRELFLPGWRKSTILTCWLIKRLLTSRGLS